MLQVDGENTLNFLFNNNQHFFMKINFFHFFNYDSHFSHLKSLRNIFNWKFSGKLLTNYREQSSCDWFWAFSKRQSTQKLLWCQNFFCKSSHNEKLCTLVSWDDQMKLKFLCLVPRFLIRKQVFCFILWVKIDFFCIISIFWIDITREREFIAKQKHKKVLFAICKSS